MNTNYATETTDPVSVSELKYLMALVLDEHANVRFRIMIGEKWTQNYLRVLLVTEKGVILNDEKTNKVMSITFLTEISEIELDKEFENFSKNYKYKIQG